MERTSPRVTFPAGIMTILTVALAAVAIGVLTSIGTSAELPILGDKTLAFTLISVPAVIVILITFVRGDLGFGLIVGAATLLIAKTGMQLDVTDIRTSALEVLVLGSSWLLAIRTLLFATGPRWPRLPIDGPLKLFIGLGLPALLIAMQRQVPWSNIVWEVKGYFLYPLLAYVMISWINSKERLVAVVLMGILAGIMVGATGIWSGWRSGIFGGARFLAEDERIGGSFGTINQYGFYLSSLALLTLGVVTSRRWGDLLGLLGIAGSGLLVLGMALTGSRGAWLGLACGLGVLLMLRRASAATWVLIACVGAGLWMWQLPYFGDRLLSLSDHSAITRVDYANVGLVAFQQFPLFGAGWGASFWLGPDNRLIPSDSLPWLHDDYLNLLMQTGLTGLISFVWIWLRMIKEGQAGLKVLGDSDVAGISSGAIAGLVALLVQAATDHVFWRPDIAGQVWWIAGILLSGVMLAKQKTRGIGWDA